VLNAGVAVTVTWTRLAATPSGDVTIVTNVYATNPAHRTITVNVTDRVYEGSTQAVQVGTATSGPKDVPANTANFLLGTFTYTVPSSATSFNDVATATYTDKLTGVPVPGTTTASASATVTTGTTTNTTAGITDSESITGSGLTFAVATPSVGAFTGGYTAGTATTGPVGWASGTQSGSGSVTFSKTIYVTAATSTSGTLSDTATLTGSDGATASASAEVNISSSTTVSLTIDKTIPAVLTGAETETFTFDIKTGGASGTIVDTASITFTAGQPTKSTTVTGLAAGTTYTVVERPDPDNEWVTQPSQTVTVNPVAGNAATCAETLTFVNSFGNASARVRKVTVPAGNEAGWEFTLNGPGAGTGEKVTTTGTGYVNFSTVLQEGNYTITETSKPGFDQTSASAECSFTVDYPADADRVFSCTYTNTQRGTIIVEKQTDPNGATGAFTFTGTAAGSIGDGGQITVSNLMPGTYTST
jgi:hypothetical protein